MKKISLLIAIAIASLSTLTVNAKIWRINNNVGVTADFTTLTAAAASASVLAGDTVHIEPSATVYIVPGSLTKRLVVIGNGYFLDPANTTTPGNNGLQVTTQSSMLGSITIANGGNGSRFIGVTFQSVNINATTTAVNIILEKCLFNGGLAFNNGIHDGVTIRKCYFYGSGINGTSGGSLTNFTCENNILNNSNSSQPFNLPLLTGGANIFRNNSCINGFTATALSNCYVANNIFGSTQAVSFSNCTIKNNLFQTNQVLPGTATGNQVNVAMATVYVGGTTGSLDSRAQLASGSPAIGAGLTVGAVVSPDCGAYGATDPYKLSGIPGIPSIYTLTVPTSIPSGTNSMNITFSTRNNN